MTPEQSAMFNLQSRPEPTPPGQTLVVDPYQAEPEVDVMAQGMAQTASYMAANGPTRPIHRRRASVITKAQLEEQKMNEAAGLPSNLDEASRVLDLEKKVQSVDSKLEQILGLLAPNVAPPLTPPVRQPVAETPLDRILQTPLKPVPQPGPSVRPTAPTTTEPKAPLSPPDSSTPPQRPLVSLGTAPDTVNEDEPPGEAWLSDADIQDFSRAAFPPGPGGAQPIPLNSGETLEELVASPGEDHWGVEEITEDEPKTKEELVEAKRLERTQILTDQVTGWLKQKDPRKFWRQFLGGSCNKNLSYNTWPKEFQQPFDERFSQMLGDAHFVANICGRILKMQNGHLVGPNVAGAFVTVVAGFLSFALIDV